MLSRVLFQSLLGLQLLRVPHALGFFGLIVLEAAAFPVLEQVSRTVGTVPGSGFTPLPALSDAPHACSCVVLGSSWPVLCLRAPHGSCTSW